jgi:hypothetical protein
MKILNLDKLSQASTRELTINGVKHPIFPMSVENFIETTRSLETLMKTGGSMVDQIEAAVDMICRCVPSVDRAVLVKYEPSVLNTIATFVRGDDVEEQEVGDEAGEAGK